MRWRAATKTMSSTLRDPRALLCVGSMFFTLTATAAAKDEFAESIRPVLAQNCAACHNPNNPRNRINFLKANTVKDIESNRGLWRNVAAQLRNRTMPPVETKLTEDDRLRVAAWIDNRLRADRLRRGRLRRRRRPAPPESPRVSQHDPRSARRGLQRLRTLPHRWHRRRGLRHQRRDALRSARS